MKSKKNEHIRGAVTGLTQAGTATHRVVVYVKTDVWYIHPYERGGDGKSWASIRSDGSWRISTLRRTFPASAVAALVVEKASKVPPKIELVEEVNNKTIVIKQLEGTEDSGKL